MSTFLAGKPRNSKQPKGMCALKISPHSFIAVTLVRSIFLYLLLEFLISVGPMFINFGVFSRVDALI